MSTVALSVDACYRLARAAGRELVGAATFGASDSVNDIDWMGVSYPGEMTPA